MKTVLMVAEKPSLAQSLAKILARGNIRQRKGLSSACAVYEYEDYFLNQPARFKFTSVCGHVMSLDFTPKYNNWDKVDPVSLFSINWQIRSDVSCYLFQLLDPNYTCVSILNNIFDSFDCK